MWSVVGRLVVVFAVVIRVIVSVTPVIPGVSVVPVFPIVPISSVVPSILVISVVPAVSGILVLPVVSLVPITFAVGFGAFVGVGVWIARRCAGDRRSLRLVDFGGFRCRRFGLFQRLHIRRVAKLISEVISIVNLFVGTRRLRFSRTTILVTTT